MNDKVKRLVRDLENGLASGRWEILGTNLPSERELKKMYGVSRRTAHAALDDLEHRGLIYRVRRRGTFPVATREGEKTVGVIVSGNYDSEIFRLICNNLKECAERDGMRLLIADASHQDPRRRAAETLELATKMLDDRIAGLIYHPIQFASGGARVNRAVQAFARERGKAFVVLDSALTREDTRDYDLVCTDNFAAGFALATEMKRRGCAQVRFLTFEHYGASIADRIRGVAAVYPEPRAIVWKCAPADERRLRLLINEGPKVDGIICHNDVVAARLLLTLKALGVRDSTQVMGFDGASYAALVTPPLTTIRQPCEALAQLAYNQLKLRLRAPDMPPRRIYLPPELVLRPW